VEEDDRADPHPHGNRIGQQQHPQVAEAENDEEDSELGTAQRQVQIVERAAQLARQRVVDMEGGTVFLAGGPGRHQESGDDHQAQQGIGDQGAAACLDPNNGTQRRRGRGDALGRGGGGS
jgi:hypothetical protein